MSSNMAALLTFYSLGKIQTKISSVILLPSLPFFPTGFVSTGFVSTGFVSTGFVSMIF